MGRLTLGALYAFLAAPAAPADAEPPPRDPNDRPFMRPRHGGAAPDGARVYDPSFAGNRSSRRALQLTVKPLFASFRVGFIGRPAEQTDPTRGAGAGLDLDLELRRPFWRRLSGTDSGHPVQDHFRRDDNDELVQTAAAGTIHVGFFGGGLAYALDVGRLLPLIEVGAGAVFVRSPDAVQAGQFGAECVDGGVCDFGLVCAQDNVCRQGAIGTVHAGIGVNILLADRWTVGGGIRYFALLNAPADFPVFLQAALQAGVRF